MQFIVTYKSMPGRIKTKTVVARDGIEASDVFVDQTGQDFGSILKVEPTDSPAAAPEPMTVVAKNSLGRDKVMDLEEFTRRAVTDHRSLAFDAYTVELADKLLTMQTELAQAAFYHLHKQQS